MDRWKGNYFIYFSLNQSINQSINLSINLVTSMVVDLYKQVFHISISIIIDYIDINY